MYVSVRFKTGVVSDSTPDDKLRCWRLTGVDVILPFPNGISGLFRNWEKKYVKRSEMYVIQFLFGDSLTHFYQVILTLAEVCR